MESERKAVSPESENGNAEFLREGLNNQFSYGAFGGTCPNNNMKKNTAILGSLILGLASSMSAQDAFWNNSDAYLGQKPPGEAPIEFAPGMLADPGAFAI
jgi:hypothetical protein